MQSTGLSLSHQATHHYKTSAIVSSLGTACLMIRVKNAKSMYI